MKKLITTLAILIAISVANAGIWRCVWTDHYNVVNCPVENCLDSTVCKITTWKKGSCEWWGNAPTCYYKTNGDVTCTVTEKACAPSAGKGCVCDDGTVQNTYQYIGVEQTCSLVPYPPAPMAGPQPR